MGFIREPKGVDFIIQSDPLTEKERKEISQFISDYKSKKSKSTSKKLVKNVKNCFHKSTNT
ncbi:hypothetical protein [Pedobacter mendelii]|uniref:Uncharacterized protein n=1 Tax=Pedobacter mendelii TaxID=1908240 RepID=A0ABQ2BPQ2_9SPHI|nr:hypothetical protein [Pedobacter mendelii]GGI29368.1 hypothetical protein GCM10008119_37280 [Pedobacter mendelii]